MQRDLAVYLIDIQQCLEELAVFVKSKTLSDYQHEAMLRRAHRRRKKDRKLPQRHRA